MRSRSLGDTLPPPGWTGARRKRPVSAGGPGGRFDVVVAGGRLGGVAATLATVRSGLRVAMTEETDWVGGQLAQQGVPPDEHQWIESHGSTRQYRELRAGIRDYYRRHYPLTDSAQARRDLNPATVPCRGCATSRACRHRAWNSAGQRRHAMEGWYHEGRWDRTLKATGSLP